jgi:predicted Co/Zn/Cd cation transporter (cation efflux family)
MRKAALYLGICLLIVVAVVGIVKGFGSEERIDTGIGVSAAVSLTEAHIEGLVTSMQVMALTDEVISADWDTMKPLLTEFENNSIPLVAWFALPNASYYTVDSGRQIGNLSDRAYFPKVMNGEVVIGDLVVSKSTGIKSAVAVVPVKNGNEVIGALGVSIYLNDLNQLIKALVFSDDMVFYAVNADGCNSFAQRCRYDYGKHLRAA